MRNTTVKIRNSFLFPSSRFLRFNGIILAFITLLLSGAAFAEDNCYLTAIANNVSTPLLQAVASDIRLEKGVNKFELVCTLSQSGVFTFTRPALKSFSWQQDGVSKTPLKTNQIAVLMEQGSFNAQLIVTVTNNYTPRFTWLNTQQFIGRVQLYNLIFGVFYGLCATLIFYVLIIGYGIKDAIFKQYGAYLFCIASFIFLQEGQPYLFAQNQFSEFIRNLYSLSIGLTVLSATWFMCAILELPQYWPKVSKFLKIAALCVLTLCLQKVALDLPAIADITSAITGYLSLLIVMSIFILSAVQAKQGVNEAGLVFIALSCVFISMTFRILLTEYSPFIQRYGFVIAFTLESLLLAIAVAKRIQRLSYAKKQAERHANYDPLCHIHNRRGWSLKANDLLTQHAQQGGILCFLYIDLDRFKVINDSYGHDVGDKVLSKVAQLINNHMRSEDAVGRLGGDEFVAMALFTSKDKINQRVATLEQKLNALSLEHQGNTIAIYASVGQINYSEAPKNLDEVLKAGDEAMYQKKSLRKAQAKQTYTRENA
ncbi:diguanylate cyclase [Pseudoalteromonas sp. SR41-8]|nr:diguanylate cyclase [Pseudoalteromonas sp. SR41-8]